MVFKRPGNSRDDRSAKAPNHYTKSEGGAKSSSSKTRSTSSHTDRTASGRPRRTADSEAIGRGKTYTSAGSKPFSKRATADDRPKRDGESSSFTGKKTFSGGRSKPYSGRPTNDDRPKRSSDSYRSGGESSGDKKPLSSDRKPYSGRPSTEDRAKRSSDSYRGGGEPSGDKRPYSSDRKPYSGRPTNDDRPKRSSDSYRSGDAASERKSVGSSYDKPAGARKYGSRDGSDFKDRPYRKPTQPRDEGSAGDVGDKPGSTMRSRKKTGSEDKGLIRLNRYISNAGICSRRKADELITAGVVSVNGEVVSELGHKVNPLTDVIRYNGETLKREKMVYVLLNKPKDYITTTDDPHERRTVMQLVEKASKERIYPIGRLDRNTTGLLLMTNDGDLADKLSHPKNNITKLYHVELSKALTQGDLNKISFGLELEDGLIKPDTISYVAGASKREVGIQIHSGKNRIVRRIFESLGYEVVKLDRVVYAGLTKKDLPRGRWRYLDEQEVIQLKHLI